MQAKSRWIIVAGVATFVVSSLGYIGYRAATGEPTPPESKDVFGSAAGIEELRGPEGESDPAQAALEEAAFIEQLQARFTPNIRNKHAQIKLIEQLVRYLQERYPNDWQARVRMLLQRMFPELADALYARFESLERLNLWLSQNRHSLVQMNAAQRRETLWAARYEAFGADAEEIWAGERRAEKLRASLATLDSANGESAAQKLDHFIATINETHGDQAKAFIEQRQSELLGSFLALNAVQAELRTLPAAERSATLRDLRKNLGMDEAALQRWDELDHGRDQAWDKGQGYMNERAAILAGTSVEQRTQRLQQLREQIFGKEQAAVILSEEEGGFYRFAQERRIGRE